MKIETGITGLLIAFFCCMVVSTQNLSAQGDVPNPVNEGKLVDTFFQAKTVVFLGDSITYQGGFLTVLESAILANDKIAPKLINLGLSSETCSGDSEPIHPFPRPDVHERFQRILEKASPDVLVVNYGMNDGIYHPFDQQRFENYQAGINKIISAAEESNGRLKVILVTPPPFDPLPLRTKGKLVKLGSNEYSWKTVYEGYDSKVLAKYSNWILEQSDRVAGCVNIRKPILEYLNQQRQTDPQFKMSKDGVHINQTGHELLGSLIAEAIEVDPSKRLEAKTEALIRQKQSILRDAWLSHVGHKRPGIKDGLPIDKANAKVEKLNAEIESSISKSRTSKQ